MLRLRFLRFLMFLHFFHSPLLAAQDIPIYTSKPKIYDFLPQAVSDVPDFLTHADPREHAVGYIQLGLLTAGLLRYDQDILIGSQEIARRWNLISESESGTGSRLVYRTKIGTADADLRLPRGLNSSMYFIGDGLSTIAILGGLSTFGALTDDLRALNTASQIAESTVLTGLVVITSKYSFGRQSPNQRTRNGGEWHPMPGPVTYLKHVSNYDAFPSGHVATAMSTLTVLAENYIDTPWIKPVGYGAIGLLMFSMLNNGVHWAADYPLGIAIGFTAAETVLQKRKPGAQASAALRGDRSSMEWSPFISESGLGLSVHYEFPSH